ncbi:hypothetical protein O7629_31785 [Solwaraspora sp. WMMD792]|nr:hypothetical protein [Solwaraspora sp. WMMD792]MDG4774899.1 hypothetical protein [Solwaraspora sp. WMMD792]
MPRGLARTRRLVDAARQGGPVVLGVCLGAQMIVESMCPGGIRGAKRIEVGLAEIEWSLEENGSLVAPAFHYEEIDSSTITDSGGEVVATNAHSPVQGFRFGGRVWGLQFHPELDPTDVRRLVHYHKRTITTYGGDIALALRSVDQLESRWSGDSFEQLLNSIGASNA